MSSGLRRAWGARRIVGSVWLPVVVLGACGGGPTSPSAPVAFLEIVGDTLIGVGSSAPFHVLARAADGSPIAAPVLTWSAPDPSIANVSVTGVVTGVQPGWARVVVQADRASDTLTLRVHVPSLAPGAVVGWISGSGGLRPIAWEGQATVYDVMGGADGDDARILVPNTGGPGIRDSVLLLSLGSHPRQGDEPIVAYPFDGSASTGIVASLLLGEAGTDLEAFYGIGGGHLTLTGIDYPTRPGLEFGEATGLLDFRAVRHDLVPGGVPVPTEDTVRVYLELRVWLQHLLRPRVSTTLVGGPVDGEALVTFGQTYREGTQLQAWWDSDLDGVPGQPWRWEAQQAVFLVTGTGTRAIEEITAAEYWDQELWPTVFSAIHYRDDPRVGLSTTGTVTITRHVAPTTSSFGEVEGSMTAEYELWDGMGSATGETVTSEATFAIPINPIGAAPLATMEAPRERWGGNR